MTDERAEGARTDVPRVGEVERLRAERDALLAELEQLRAELAADDD